MSVEEYDRLICESRELRVDPRHDIHDVTLQLVRLGGGQGNLNEHDLVIRVSVMENP